MKHLMIDLETMGNTPSAAIVAIGARFFDPYDDSEVGDSFYGSIDLEDSVRAGLVIDASTVKWWMTQPKEARDAAMAGEGTLSEVLSEFKTWIKSNRSKKLTVWSHSTFDIPVLAAAYRVCGESMPWHYRETCDIRTLNHVVKDYTKVERDGTHHHALDDVDFQIKYVSSMLKKLDE